MLQTRNKCPQRFAIARLAPDDVSRPPSIVIVGLAIAGLLGCQSSHSEQVDAGGNAGNGGMAASSGGTPGTGGAGGGVGAPATGGVPGTGGAVGGGGVTGTGGRATGGDSGSGGHGGVTGGGTSGRAGTGGAGGSSACTTAAQQSDPTMCFACGASFCQVNAEYCQDTSSHTGDSYRCFSTPTACLPIPTCACLNSSNCTQVAAGALMTQILAP